MNAIITEVTFAVKWTATAARVKRDLVARLPIQNTPASKPANQTSLAPIFL